MIEQTEADRNSDISINPVSRADLPAIETILRATVQNPYGSGDIDENEVATDLARITSALESPEATDTTLVARDGNHQVLGFAFSGTPDPRLTSFTGSDPKKTLELKLLYIDPSRRKSGVGSRLLKAVEQGARQSGKSKVELTSGPRYILIGSGRFYVKQGYTLVGTIPNYFEDEYWAKVFQKQLG